VEDALKRAGIAARKIERGQIYVVRDDIIVLPRERLPRETKRTVHEHRLVLILQTDLDNSDPPYLFALVAPLSHRVEFQDERDYALKANQGGLDQDSVVHLGLVQPILKIDLEQDAIGKLDALTMNDIDAILAANLGLIERHSQP